MVGIMLTFDYEIKEIKINLLVLEESNHTDVKIIKTRPFSRLQYVRKKCLSLDVN